MFSAVSTANRGVGAKLSETHAFLSSNIATCFEIAWHSLMACKKKMMLCSVSKLREPHDLSIHLTKILFQLKCKLHVHIHDMSIPLHVESDSCNHSSVGIFSHKKKHLEKLLVFVFHCEGKILLTLFGDHTNKKFPAVASSEAWQKKIISDPHGLMISSEIECNQTLPHIKCFG